MTFDPGFAPFRGETSLNTGFRGPTPDFAGGRPTVTVAFQRRQRFYSEEV